MALNYPCGVAFAAGHLLVSDGFVQKVNARTGWLTTPAGAVRSASRARGEQVPLGDGGPAKLAAASACGTSVDKAGNLVVADHLDRRIRVVAASTGTFYGQPMTAGHIYTVAGSGGKGFSGDGGLATRARLRGPGGVAVDGAGNLVIADSHNNRVRVVAAATGTFYGHAMTAHDIYTVASWDRLPAGRRPALAGRIVLPVGIAVDSSGNLLVSEQGLGVVSTDRRVRLVAASNGTFYGQRMTAGDIYTVAAPGGTPAMAALPSGRS